MYISTNQCTYSKFIYYKYKLVHINRNNCYDLCTATVYVLQHHDSRKVNNISIKIHDLIK